MGLEIKPKKYNMCFVYIGGEIMARKKEKLSRKSRRTECGADNSRKCNKTSRTKDCN